MGRCTSYRGQHCGHPRPQHKRVVLQPVLGRGQDHGRATRPLSPPDHAVLSPRLASLSGFTGRLSLHKSHHPRHQHRALILCQPEVRCAGDSGRIRRSLLDGPSAPNRVHSLDIGKDGHAGTDGRTRRVLGWPWTTPKPRNAALRVSAATLFLLLGLLAKEVAVAGVFAIAVLELRSVDRTLPASPPAGGAALGMRRALRNPSRYRPGPRTDSRAEPRAFGRDSCAFRTLRVRTSS